MRRRVISGFLAAVFVLGLFPRISLPARAATSLPLATTTLTSGEYDLAAGHVTDVKIEIKGNVTINVKGTSQIDNMTAATQGPPIRVTSGALTLNIPSGGELYVRGRNGTDGALATAGRAAAPGIRVCPGATLILKGKGELRAFGGHAGNGGNGGWASGLLSNYNGGGGGGGGAAAIGGNGGNGQYDVAGGMHAPKGEDSGEIYIYDTFSYLQVVGGDGGDGGSGAVFNGAPCIAGGGGGGGGYPGAGIGGGGAGGGGGGGGKLDVTSTYRSVENGHGGFSGGGGSCSGKGTSSSPTVGAGGKNGLGGEPGNVGSPTDGGGGGGYLGPGGQSSSSRYMGGEQYGGGGNYTDDDVRANYGGYGGTGTVYYRPSATSAWFARIKNGGAKNGTAVPSQRQVHEGLGCGYGYMATKIPDTSVVCEFYEVKFDLNGASGTAPDLQLVPETKYVFTPSPPSRSGYVFDGWYTDTTYTTKWNFGNHPTKDMILYAKWKPTVTFDSQGGTSVSSQTVEPGGKVTEPKPVPTKANNTFDGWYKEAKCTTPWNFSTGKVTAKMTLYAKWLPDVTLTYDGNGYTGGTLPAAQGPYAAKPPTTVTVNPSGSTVTRTGYTFVGWNTNKGGTGTTYQDGDPITLNSSVTLYAQWKADPKVTYHLRSVACNPPYNTNIWSVTTTYNGLVTEPVLSTTNPGYDFLGWYEDYDPYTKGPWNFASDTVKNNMDLYAKWEVQVDYDAVLPSSLVTAPAPVKVIVRSALSQPTITEPAGYTLKGWYTDKTYTTQWPFVTTGTAKNDVRGPMTLYAKWEVPVNFDLQGHGTAIPTVNATVGQPLGSLAPATPTDPNYTFDGWYKESTYNTPWNLSTDTVSEPMTLYAKWKENLYVTYDGNKHDSGTVPTKTGPHFQGDNVTAASGTSLSRKGYTFDGWLDEDGNPYPSGGSFTISKSVTLYAQWKANGMTVTYDLQGVPCSNYASNTWSVPTPYNSYLSPPTTPTPTGTRYVFQGWYENSACTGTAWDFTNNVVAADMTLYAKWDVTVNYDPVISAVMPPPSVTATVGGTLSAPTITVLPNYTFVGWYTDKTFATQWAFGPTGTPVAGPMDLFAKWEVAVNFYLQGHGAAISPISNATVGLPLGSKAPADPTETGWTFGGWYTDAACTAANKWNMSTSTVDGPTDLYAKWTENEHTVTYLNGGATGSAPTDTNSPYKFGTTVTVMGQGALSWPGKVFNGWMDQDGVARAAGSTFTMPDNDMILTAQWSNGTYTVAYDANTSDPALKGTVPTDGNTYGYGDPVIIQGNTGSLRWPGHTFLGWNTSSTATTALSGSYTILGDTTFFAIWEEDEYEVTYDGNGATGTAPSDSTKYRYDAPVTVLNNPSTGLTMAGATFQGWNTDPGGLGTSYAPGATFNIQSDVTLYAMWESEQYHITYNGNNNTAGAAPIDAKAYVLNDPATILGDPALARDGYTFKGWNTASNGSGTDYTVGQAITVPGNLLLYAKWEAKPLSVTYVATDTGVTGNVPVDSTVYYYDQPVTVLGNVGTPAPLDLVGKTFAGWAMVQTPTASDPIYSAGSSFQIKGDTTLYAQWKNAEYHVTYVGNGADGGTLPVDPKGYRHGTQALVMTNTLTYTNHVFKEWNTQADGLGTGYVGTGVGSIPSMVSDVILYAIWEEQAFTVTYFAPRATGTVPVDPNAYASMDPVTVLGRSSLERTGYSFAGWNTKANGLGTTYKPGATFFITEPTDLYAVWSNLYYIYISANTDPVIFDAAHKEYTATVPYDTDFVDLAVAYSEGTVTYSIGIDNPAAGTSLASLQYVKVPLNVGVNKIFVHGTDSLGRTLNYVYTVTRQQKSSGGGGGGGGGGTTYYYPVVYLPGEGGTLPGDVATEQVSSGGKPKKVPTVTEKGGYVFKGWSLDGKKIVDPTTVKVKELTTFIALYEFDESSVPEHVWYMQGYGNGLFRPDDPLSRSEITAMLSRLDESYRQGAKLPSFPDVGASAWYYSYVGHAQGVGLIHGYPDGTFRPDNKISRAEFVTIMCNHLGLKNTGSATFTDTSGHWAEGYIAQLTALGVLNGYPDGTFRPDGEISRSEAAKIVNRVYQRQPDPELVKGHALHYDDVPSHHWAWSDIVEASYAHKTTEFH